MSRIWSSVFLLIALLPQAQALNDSSYAHPFGIKAKVVTFPVDSSDSFRSWQLHFNSAKEFVETIRQPSFQLLTSGRTAVVYYAVLRVQPDIYLYVSAFVKDQKSNGSYSIHGGDRNDSILRDETNNPKIVEVLDAVVKLSSTGIVPAGGLLSETRSIPIYGYAAKVRQNYNGPITFHAQNWNEGLDKVHSSNSVTVEW